VNQAVAIQYPKLRAKYGNSVRYAQDKTARFENGVRIRYGAGRKNRYAPQQYHDFIGFQLSKSLLERVFPVIYGVELQDARLTRIWLLVPVASPLAACFQR